MYAFSSVCDGGYPTNGSSAASLSSSQRSSLIPNVSCRFSASNPSTNAQEYAAADRSSACCVTLQPSRNQQADENITRSAPSTRTSLPVCFTCNVVLSSQSALARHYKEICEPEVTRICPVCRWTGERLMRHYANTHSGQCSTGYCGKRTERVCDECRQQLSGSFVKNEAKKAWGCPYCVSCFHARDLWTRHCYDHYHQDGNDASWSYQTMIWSLLQHPDLERDRLQYNWDGYNWSEITEKTRPGLRDALQRHQVPTDLRLYANYRHLEGPRMLVEYAYQYVMTGQPYFYLVHHIQPGTRSPAQEMVSSQLMSELPFTTTLQYSDAEQLPQGPTLLHEIAPGSQGNFRDMSMKLPVTYEDEYRHEHTDFTHNFETIATSYTLPATTPCGVSFQPDSAVTGPNFSTEHACSSCAKQIPADHVKPPYWSFRLLKETLVHPTEQQPIPPYFDNGEQLGSPHHPLSISEYPYGTQDDCADRMQSHSEQPLAILPANSYERIVPQTDANTSVAEHSPGEWQTCTRPFMPSDLPPMSDIVEEWIWPMS